MSDFSEKIAVSVICTTYNQEKYIRDTLDGLVMQKTNFPFEIIVHDDASPDSTADIVREYEAKYPDLIRPIYETENQYYNKGVIRRVCSEKARGRYFAFCEGDDYWTDPLKLQKQFDFMEAHPDYSLCACSVDWVDQLSGKIIPKGRTDKDKDVSIEDLILEKKGRLFVFVSYFLKREYYENQPSWDFPIGDYPLAVYAAMNGKVHMLADVMCVYRYNAAGSWSQRMNGDEQRKRVSERMITSLENMNRFSGGKYEKVIHERILSQRYICALMSHDFSIIKQDPELYQMHMERKPLLRLSDRMRCSMPKTYHLINRLLKREE